MHRRHVHQCACGNVWTCRREDCGYDSGLCRDCEEQQRMDWLEARYHQQARVNGLPVREQPLPLEV
jgi:hypothetical protein